MQLSTPDRTQQELGVDMNVLRKGIIILTGTLPLGRYEIGLPVVTLSPLFPSYHFLFTLHLPPPLFSPFPCKPPGLLCIRIIMDKCIT